jgi:hypothetical protein
MLGEKVKIIKFQGSYIFLSTLFLHNHNLHFSIREKMASHSSILTFSVLESKKEG